MIADLFPYTKTGVTYLDSAASTQKPATVLDAINRFYQEDYANVHRGLHRLAERATLAYERARGTVARHLGCDASDLAFTSGTTDAMNLLAAGFPLTADDSVIVTALDHHSTFVPWQQAAQRAGATFTVLPVDGDARLDYNALRDIIDEHGCTVMACLHVSNVTGEVIDIQRIARMVRGTEGVLVVDGAQALPHLPVDVKSVDAYACSGHKAYGPTGIGGLYIRPSLSERLPPFRYGGEMVDTVTTQRTTFRAPPYRFEAGTPPIAQAVGFAAAIEFLEGMEGAWDAEQRTVDEAYEKLSGLDFIDIIGTADRAALVSFTMQDVHAHDVAQFLDGKDVAVRAGHHCTQPLHDALGIPASVRASFGLYNTSEDVDRLIDGLKRCKEAFDV